MSHNETAPCSYELLRLIENSKVDLSGFKPLIEAGSVIAWENPNADYEVYATPFYDWCDYIPVFISCDGDADGPVFKIYLKHTGNVERDCIAYLKAMKDNWERIMNIAMHLMDRIEP